MVNQHLSEAKLLVSADLREEIGPVCPASSRRVASNHHCGPIFDFDK
jgi:hypothetical protein